MLFLPRLLMRLFSSPLWRWLAQGCLTIGTLIALSACSPTYDWRQLQHPTYPYRALFPAKPVSATRAIPLAGADYPLSLQSAKIGDTLFAVAIVTSPAPTDRAQLEQIQQALLLSWSTNIRAQHAVLPLTAPTRAGQPILHEIWQEARGEHQGQPYRLQLRSGLLPAGLIGPISPASATSATGGGVYAALVIGPAAAWLPDQVDTFLQGFELIQPH
ncbi:hypothetical protein [Parvibium lacunae]|uniref:Uncharacterized protein n=1 Tax=Parvibium lacunae TaxID=1888893 RepID=A0A368L105_9BURK|nr:hypothetical protein [Parvibium lacunae]RCS57115.1 hypothetical protein DU000_09945 [Parvibium lacunae]